MQSSYGRGKRAAIAAVLCVASACAVNPFSDGPSGSTDGAQCDANEDCRSGVCDQFNKLCAHSKCDCPGDTCSADGEVSNDCASGWLCFYSDSLIEDIGTVFGVERDYDGGVCQPKCSASCPEHYSCSNGGLFCVADPYWTYPVPTLHWSGGVDGTMTGREKTMQVALETEREVMLHADAESPAGVAITSLKWTLTSNGGMQTQVEGANATFMLTDMEQGGRADLTVTDADTRSSFISVVFNGCQGTGKACGFQGSGCCNGCDARKEFCL
jgi:hypothetical protein